MKKKWCETTAKMAIREERRYKDCDSFFVGMMRFSEIGTAPRA